MLVHYPAVFEESKPYGYSVIFPDLNNLATEGKTYDEALKLAIECLAGYIWDLEKLGESLPQSSQVDNLTLENNEFPVVISVDVEAYAKEHFEKAVKKTLTLPKWLNDAAQARGIKFSKVLQKALKAELGIED